MSEQAPNEARVIPLRPPVARPSATRPGTTRPASERPATAPPATAPPRAAPKEPLWRDLVGDVLRRERLAQERTLKDVADAARISMPYLSEVERGRKEASSEVLAAAAHALGLGLGDLLSLAQGELVRVTSRRVPGGSRGRTGSSYDGLCLAA
ncbi:helix-turn-helix domain-containing protein [Streptomyces chartreusis]|uniref:Helix-turn-helix transcriptional regulator n=1 Tax=Streptomyces chartreusis TaxID=1969 RepID=A0A7H8TJF8_STRCX|nr:helix-turn-helix transcriptional regulator [Streptomyces chartreusis]QKZ23653.1 helix-turn-helix transcriptional regulator [Streptomyces chartreusis]